MLAHINEKNEEQTVRDHLVGVAQRAAFLGQKLGLEKTMFLTGVLHDLGKERLAFDDYLRRAVAGDKSVYRGMLNHSSAGGKYLLEYLGGDDEADHIAKQLMAGAIFAHHGVMDIIDPDGVDHFAGRVEPQDDIAFEEVLANNKALFEEYDLDDYYAKAKAEIQIKLAELMALGEAMVTEEDELDPEDALFFVLGCLERLILSLLVEADRSDTASFMDGRARDELEPGEATAIWDLCRENIEARIGGFTIDLEINKARSQLSDECLAFSQKEPGIYKLYIPTGGGKTLASLRYGVNHALHWHKDRIFYIAPFLSILEQNAKEIRDTLDVDGLVLEHHSNVVVDKDEDQKSRDEKNSDNNDREIVSKYQLLTESWNSQVVATTLVQFLNTLFSNKMQSVRRFNRLTNAVVIIDEIQSLPISTIYLFNTMANFLSRVCGTTFVLCSATQPLLGEVRRKILYGEPPEMIAEPTRYTKAFKRVEVIDETLDGGYDTEALASFVAERFDENMLVILNTKSSVKKLCEALRNKVEPNVEIVKLTTYFCPAHRRDIIARLKDDLGNKPILCVSTQLIEAGVDISFKQVVRSLAGMDSIAQAAGRCNRNGNDDLGSVCIVNYNEENTSRLIDIQEGKRTTQKILDWFNYDPGQYGGDYLSTAFMDKYYEHYFFGREARDEMEYLIKDKNYSIYDLLSSNAEAKKVYERKMERKLPYHLKQAFKEAGKHFKVIDSDTVGLFVPYKEGKELIAELRQSREIEEIQDYLRRLQPYTVNLFRQDSTLKDLIGRGAIDDSVLDGRVWILHEDYYNEKTGIATELQNYIY